LGKKLLERGKEILHEVKAIPGTALLHEMKAIRAKLESVMPVQTIAGEFSLSKKKLTGRRHNPL